MEKTYSPKDIEQHWYSIWEQEGYFSPKQGNGSYCLMLPPPNVTGSLHMGHGFQHTLMDILTRYHRMKGLKVLWQPGTDHAGISTQLVVERQLEAEGTSRKEMTREAFLARVAKWKETSGGTITQQMRRMGTSTDWSRERFTMDQHFSAAVQKVFVQLYDEGLIYRGTRLVNWDPKLGTAVSDLEVVSEEEDGFLWYISYPLVDSSEQVVVATTRPETLLGDTAVAVHPDDARYAHLIGQKVKLPLTERTIPIIADDTIDPEFGTGCVKITPAHDFNDHEIGKRHELPIINIFSKKAMLNKEVPPAYQGMDRFVAREAILKDLSEQGLLVKTVPHRLKVPRGEKSSVVIEPFLTDQWYVKTKPLARPAMEAVRKGDIRIVPENWSKTYFQWMENIEDWCISRQLWWGHRIPAWYDSKGHIYVGYSENDVRFKYNIDKSLPLRQDEDVLDTWFSSALWPFATLGWPEKTPELEQFYPTSVLVTGFDILFFWVARMIMMGLKFTGKVPFKDVVITGLVRDSEGQKMSKTKGNVLDPLDMIDGITLDNLLIKRTESLIPGSNKETIIRQTRKEFPEGIYAYGADALRFTFTAIASTGRNVRFDMGRVEGYHHFCNKLWNAARYVTMNIDEEHIDWEDGAFQYSQADQWILSRLQKTLLVYDNHIQAYRFDLLANAVYDFVWHEYCDWYLELSKIVLHDEKALPPLKRGTRRTLIHVLDTILKMLHPIMPFITEEIWQLINRFTSTNGETILLSPWPEKDASLINEALEEEMEQNKLFIQSVRTIRSEMGIPPGKRIPLFIKNASSQQKERCQTYEAMLVSLCKLSRIHYVEPSQTVPVSASTIIEGMECLIPMAGLINQEVELARLVKELARLEKDIEISKKKLENPDFVERAPEDVVQKQKEKLEELEKTFEKLKKHEELVRVC